jgi:hypothetical protein
VHEQGGRGVAWQQVSLDEYAHGHHDGGVPASRQRMTLKAGHVSRPAACFFFFFSLFPLFPPKIASSKGKQLDRVNKFFSELQCSATTTTSCGHHTHCIDRIHWIHSLYSLDPLDPLTGSTGSTGSTHWIHSLNPLDPLMGSNGSTGSTHMIHWIHS